MKVSQFLGRVDVIIGHDVESINERREFNEVFGSESRISKDLLIRLLVCV